MPWSALPEHINEPHEWKNTDWDNSWQRWLLRFKGWFAFGPRATEWWAKWRPIPIDLFNLNATRKEKVQGLSYTSIIQYWRRGHLLIQWPFHVSCHWYWKKQTVPKTSARPGNFKITQMVFIRLGARFDNDQVYWFPSLFIGGDFN